MLTEIILFQDPTQLFLTATTRDELENDSTDFRNVVIYCFMGDPMLVSTVTQTNVTDERHKLRRTHTNTHTVKHRKFRHAGSTGKIRNGNKMPCNDV